MVDIRITRILYMEDDPGLSRLLQKSLQRRGYLIDTAADGEDGLAKLAAVHYDLLLVDYDMPFLGGIEVIRTLSAKGPLMPTIMVTGQGNEEVAVEALKLGAVDYVVKDTEMKYLELLPVVIDRVLYRQHILQERKQMEELVRESEERYRLLVELSPEGIAVHADGQFVFMNPAGARLFGADAPEQLIGQSVRDRLHPDSRGLADARLSLAEYQRNRTPWAEGKFVRFDGQTIDVEMISVANTYQGKPAAQMIFRDISERNQAKERLEHLALYDALTGLPNRTLFFDRMEQLLTLAKRHGYILALLSLDLDHFKSINDSLGHETGDLLLAEAAKRMMLCARKSDTIARMSGDEFIGVCGKITTPLDAALVAKKMIAALSEPFYLNGRACRVVASIGISIFPLDGEDVETLLSKAGAAMHSVKQAGKGGYAYTTPL